MMDRLCHHFLVALLLLSSYSLSVTSECLSTADYCEFTFNVHFKQTMVNAANKLVYLHEGELYHYTVTNTSSATPVSINDVITADGFPTPQLVVAINGQMPGPTISVYQGQKIVVNVNNQLHSDTIAIHWHGIHQRNTPWMDGSAYITQCPILPGHSFRYEFYADQTGTYFYHSHIGMLGSMGLHGPLIIKPRNVDPPLEEFIVMLTEWNNRWEGDMSLEKNKFSDYSSGVSWSVKAIDGTALTRVRFDAGLVNGRGRHFDEAGVPNTAPLTTYKVTKGSRYRFRVIGGGYAFPFRVSVDGHNLTIVASDGSDIEPVTAESFVLHNGERYDFILTADQEVSNYWLRAQTLEANVDHKAEAIVHYDGAVDGVPTSTPLSCTSTSPCIIVNCPFKFYPGVEHSMCVTFDQLNSNTGQPALGVNSRNMPQHFLNFGFPGAPGYRYGSVNGRSFLLPKSPPLTQPMEMTTHCDPSACGSQKICRCSYTLDIAQDQALQLVFTNYGNGASGPHPIHLHGHVFQVLKMGFYQQDAAGQYTSDNPDITCDGIYCNGPSWSNTSWTPTTIPGLKLDTPPLKDTLIITKGSYAVVRFQTDNPGVWMLHCHMDPHMSRGMSMLINVTMSRVPKPPTGFPTCREFPAPAWVTDNMASNSATTMEPEDMDDEKMSMTTFWVVVGILLGLVVLEGLLVVYLCTTKQREKSSFHVTT